MKKFLVINGANMNLLGVRQPDVYGVLSLEDLNAALRGRAAAIGVSLDFFQSNHEGEIIDAIHAAPFSYEGIIINPAAHTHYSYAIADALSAVKAPAVEVHMSDITAREDFRKTSVTAPSCIAQFYGKGLESYFEAVVFLDSQTAKKE